MKEGNIFYELWDKFKSPWTISFSLYFVFFVVIIGGVGVFLSIIRGIHSNDLAMWPVAENIITYSISLALPAEILLIQSVFSTKNKVSLIIIVVSSIFVVLGFSAISYVFKNIILPIMSMFISWLIWIVANSNNEYLDDKSFEKMIRSDIENHGSTWNEYN